MINAAEYGYQQRRRRTFIFAYRDDTAYAGRIINRVGYVGKDEETHRASIGKIILRDGFFAKSFPVENCDDKKIKIVNLPDGIGELSSSFSFMFENTGVMKDGVVYTLKTAPDYSGTQITLGDIMEDSDVDESFFIPKERLYYTSTDVDHSDETHERLSDAAHKTWQYVKGAKKLPRQAKNGHEYIFSE